MPACTKRFGEGRRALHKLKSKKKVGLKYCGGCNPFYNRVEMVQQLQSLLEKQFIFSDAEQQDIDILVFVNGCPRSCANDKALNHPEVPFRSIIGESDFMSLARFLLVFCKKGDG
jgi:hypothetical protein